jgi:TonB dependent receptor/CarboxypepD_reg-like domain/TonB-dependent Receptor Plug Domain
MSKLSKILFLLLFPIGVFAQKVTVNGYVKDAKNGETLIGSSVFVKELKTGVSTNNYGFYSITLPQGNYNLIFTSVGYERTVKPITVTGTNLTFNLEMKEEGTELSEVVVSSKREDENVKSLEMSVNKVEMKTIKKIPALLGEVDLVRAIQLLPGVSTVGEGATGFNVRGGGVDQNLVLLDDAPVYNSSHLLGFFSVFNPDAVKDVKLVKGGIPAQYGGRASSILDVRMKEGNAKKLEINGGIGLIFSRISVEAPIIKDKASFIVAARRSYADVLARPFLKESQKDNLFNFYDLTAKVNYNINQKNTVFLSGYFGRDVFGQKFSFNWGNSTLSTRWNHVFNDKLFMNTTVFYSNYDYLLDSDAQNKNPKDAFKWSSNIVNTSVKPDFTYYFSPNNTLTFGGQVLTYSFKPGKATVTSSGDKSDLGQPDKNGIEYSAYVGNELKVSEKLSLQYGLRYSKYDYSSKDDVYYERKSVPVSTENPNGIDLDVVKNTKDATIKSYQNFEPRLSVKLQLGEQSSIKSSYNRMSQYIHLMSNTAAATPLDVWTSSTNNIKPQIADQITLGYFKNFGKTGNDFEASIELYYKELQNQIDYTDNANLFLNATFEKDLLFGKGRAYGAEFFLKKNKGKLTGWASYTLGRTERKVEGLAQGQWYLSRYDRTHTLNLVAQYELNKKWSFGANFSYVTGVPYTLPEQKIVYSGGYLPIIPQGTRGNIRVPDYHRLDISATKKNKHALFGKGESEWVFGVYNLYNRRNPFSVYAQTNPENSLKTEAVQLSIIGSAIPSITYNFKF